MEKFYNNPAWHRIRGLRGLGILALSVAFCLTGLLVLSSCDLGSSDDDDEETEPTVMKGFYSSVNEDGTADCTNETIDLRLEEAGDLSDPNIRITASGVDFGSATFVQVGVKVDKSDTNPETISSYYVSETDGNFDRPGAYFLAAKIDDDIAEGETIYTGYWAGYLYRRAPNATGYQPVVICPYVMVPEGTALEEIAEGSCGGMDETSTHPALAKYLMKDSGLRACHTLLDADGVLDPTERQ